MALGTLSIDIEARLAKLEHGMDKATRLIEQRNKRIESAFAAATKAAGAFVSLVGGLGVTAFARSVIDGVDALNDFADATGTTVENASALEDVALRTGTGIDTVSTAMVRFNSELAKAKPGSDGARVFEQLGLDAAKLRDLDPAEALLQTAQALQQYADDGNKARLVQELFGKSVREVAPFLKDLADAGKLNATVTAEQAQEAERFAKAISSLQKDMTDFARAVLNDALPAVTRFFREIRAAQQTGGVLGRVFRWQREQVPGGTDTENLLAARQQLQQIEQNITRVSGRIGGGENSTYLRQELIRLQTEAADARQDVRYYELLLGITNVQGGRGSIVPGGRPSVGGLPDRPAAGKSGAAAALAEFGSPEASEALRRLESVDSEKLAALREQLERLVRIGAAGDARGFEAARQVVDEITRLDPAARAAADAQRELERALEEGRRIYEETRTPAEQLAAEIERLNKLLQSGAIDWDTYARAQFAAQDRFDQAVAKSKDSSEQLSRTATDLGMTFSSAFEDAIVNGEKFSDVLKAIEKDIVRIITRNLVTQPAGDAISKWIQGGITAGSSSGGSAGAGFDWGKLLGALFEGWFADGGYIPPGRWGMVGERGPEPAYGGRSGLTVRPNSGATVVVNINGAAGGSRMAAQQQAELVGREVMLALNRNG